MWRLQSSFSGSSCMMPGLGFRLGLGVQVRVFLNSCCFGSEKDSERSALATQTWAVWVLGLEFFRVQAKGLGFRI